MPGACYDRWMANEETLTIKCGNGPVPEVRISPITHFAIPKALASQIAGEAAREEGWWVSSAVSDRFDRVPGMEATRGGLSLAEATKNADEALAETIAAADLSALSPSQRAACEEAMVEIRGN